MATQATQGFRLSLQQRYLWQAQGEGEVYCSQCAVLAVGYLAPEVLRQIFRDLVRCHEILRTVFRRRPGMKLPIQVVASNAEPDWVDLGGEPWGGGDETDERALAADLLRQHRARPWDLAVSSPLRLSLLPLAPQRNLLLVSLPAVCADPVTLRNLIARAAESYRLTLARRQPEEDPLQYADFAQWQDEMLGEEDAEAQAGKAFWAAFDPSRFDAVRLPIETESPAGRPFAPSVKPLALDVVPAGRLEEIAASAGVPLPTLFFTAWQVLLWRLCGREDLVIGRSFDGRGYSALQEALGPFARDLPMRVSLTGGERFRNLLERVREAEDKTERMQEFGGLDRASPARFAVVFESEEWSPWHPVPGLEMSLCSRHCCRGRFKLKLCAVRVGERTTLELHYDPEVLPEHEASGWVERLQTLLEDAATHPDRMVGDLDVLGRTDREQFASFNATEWSFGEAATLQARFAEQAARVPEAPAVAAENRLLTYSQLDRRANQLARHLRHLGVGAEDRVAILLERSEAPVVALLGVLKAGGVYLPLDPVFPRQRLAVMLGDAAVAAVVTEAGLLELLPDCGTPVVCLDRDADLLASYGTGEPESVTLPDHLAYVLFTSGSTGRPKGVAVEHRQLVNYTDGILVQLAPPPAASFALVSTFAADLGNTMVFPALLSGGCLHVLSQERAASPSALAEYFRRHAIDYLKIVPSHLSALLVSSEAADLLPRRLLVVGGEASSWDLAERVGMLSAGCRILNHYGPTEATVGVLAWPVDRERKAGSAARLPLGRPLANSAVHLLDPRQQPVPPGVEGEICIGGAGLARGYLGRPELTAERFIPDSFAAGPGKRLYRTGDLARFRPDGTIEFLGRLDHQIKIRGFRIELGEIGAVLAQHPEVWEAVVNLREDGSGDGRLVAYAVPRQGKQPAADDLRAFLRQRLPEYMIPASFVTLRSLPLTPNGKVDFKALPAPERTAERERPYVPPATPSETRLAEIWSQVLGKERLSIQDNFFDLGGDSILAIQVVARANRAGLRLTPKQLFEHQTIARLAAVAGSGPEILAEQGTVTGAVPLTPIQRWFFAQGFRNQHHWNQSLLLEVAPAVTPAVLDAALLCLVGHHDALRSRFEPAPGGFRQMIAARETAALLGRVDLSGLPQSGREQALETAAGEIQASLDIARGPLLRAALFALRGGERERLLLAVHHLVVDGVSWRVLLEDLETVCRQIGGGGAAALPPKTTAFQQWAERLAAHAQCAALDGELTSWLAAVPATAIPLPRDHAGGDLTVGTERAVAVSLEPEETRALLQDVSAVYRTQIEDVLLAALVRGFGRWTGRASLLVEMEGHGREPLFDDLDVSRTVGWFTTHFPLWLDLGRCAGPGEALLAVKERVRSVPNRGIGYGLLRYLREEEGGRALGALGEPQVKLNYLGQLDPALAGATLLRPAAGPRGPERSPCGLRSTLLGVDGGVAGGRFYLRLSASGNAYRDDTLRELAGLVLAELRALIAHCLSPTAGSCEAADFPLAGLDREGLARLFSALPLPAGIATSWELRHRLVEDVYPASPLQQSLLFHALSAPATTVGFEQKSTRLRGVLDPRLFRNTWQRVVDRHPILRTALVSTGLDEPLQVVYRRLDLPLAEEDLRDLSAEEQEVRLQVFLQADRQRELDPATAPLMRIALFRLAEDVCQFVWSYHHLLLDAWCRTLVLREVFAIYSALAKGQDPELPPSRPFRDYIAWLRRQNCSQAEEFWRRQLLPLPASAPWSRRPPAAAAREPSGTRFRLSAAATECLHAFARRHKLTLSTLLHGAWALLSARYHEARDVIFGTTVSGRPPELPGIEAMAGMFINNLPVRLDMPAGAPLVPWLTALQLRLAELRQYEWCSPAQIQEWSGAPPGRRLFDSLVLFQNYPVDSATEPELSTGLEILAVQSRFETGYPLTVVAGPLEPLTVRLFYQAYLFDPAAACRLAGHLETLLTGLVGDPERPLASLPLLDAAERQQILVEWNDSPAAGETPWILRSFEGWAERSAETRLQGEVRIYLLSALQEPVPAGVPGEMYVGGGAVRDCPGDAVQTAASLLPDPFAGAPGARLLRTGDRARLLSDGRVELMGIGETAEAEAVLCHHPAVREGAVTVWEDGAGEHHLVAYVAPAGEDLYVNALHEFLKDRLPRGKVPGLYVRLDRLPRTAGGRLDRQALPAPDTQGLWVGPPYVPPCDPLELRLKQIWEELFGIRPIGLRDDFFALGGHSLLAVRLTARIRSEFGRDLPLAALLQAANVQRLAEVLRQQAEPPAWTPLVPIQTGGAQPPLFCIHPVGGEVLCYTDLAHYLGTDQPVYGLQSHAWAGDDGEGPATVETMAATYIAALRQVQAAGPYRLLGYSLGGLLALEMARQLADRGEVLDLLAVLDTLALPIESRTRDFAEILFDLSGEHPSLSVESLRTLEPEAQFAYFVEKANTEKFLPGLDLETVRRYARAGKVHNQARHSYVLRPYPGRIVLFRATSGHVLHCPDPSLGWSRLAVGGLEVQDVPGSHDLMIQSPHVQILAVKLLCCLGRRGVSSHLSRS